MNKQATFLLLSLLALLSMAASASADAAPTPQAGARHDLTIFFSNDVKGETEPCG